MPVVDRTSLWAPTAELKNVILLRDSYGDVAISTSGVASSLFSWKVFNPLQTQNGTHKMVVGTSPFSIFSPGLLRIHLTNTHHCWWVFLWAFHHHCMQPSAAESTLHCLLRPHWRLVRLSILVIVWRLWKYTSVEPPTGHAIIAWIARA